MMARLLVSFRFLAGGAEEITHGGSIHHEVRCKYMSDLQAAARGVVPRYICSLTRTAPCAQPRSVATESRSRVDFPVNIQLYSNHRAVQSPVSTSLRTPLWLRVIV